MKMKNILLLSIASLGLLAFSVSTNNNSKIQIPENLNNTEFFKIKSDTSKSKDNRFESTEVMPEFPGGIDSLMAFISRNFKYPEEARKNKISGRVLISFIVNVDGKLSDIKALLPKERQLGYGLEEEGIRVVSIMPDWIPGNQRGVPIKVRYTLPFYCTLDELVIEDKKEKKKNKK